MEEKRLKEIIIEKPDEQIKKAIKQKWDHIAKPLDGMGQFEDIIARIGAILGEVRPDLTKKAIIVMCADNGITEEGISQSKQEVTKLLTSYMGEKKTSVCKMAQHIHADVIPVDIGINTEEKLEGVLDRKIMRGTKNFLKEPAMTRQQVIDAIETGMDLVKTYKEKGYCLIATGEMGMGNTTTSAAVSAALLDSEIRKMTGRGAGASDEALLHKQKVIEQGLKKYHPDKEDVLEILSCVGGLDIAGMTGLFIGGAVYHVPIVMDGVISVTAALAAERLKHGVREYLIPSHMSREPAAKMALKELRIHPIIDASLALGEGTGAVLMFALLDMAMSLYNDPLTFEDISMEKYTRSQS